LLSPAGGHRGKHGDNILFGEDDSVGILILGSGETSWVLKEKKYAER
jgi:hypothetical protein